jgi:hypothetical protein
MNDTTNVFITKHELVDNLETTFGKISYTNILETIPKNHVNTPLTDWQNTYKTEWRWRFLKLPDDRFTVEISYIKSNKPDRRIYFNRTGDWVNRQIDQVYDNYVVKQCYYYSDN